MIGYILETVPTNITDATTTIADAGINSQERHQQPQTWLFVAIIVPCVLVIIAICGYIWLYKNMQKHKGNQQQETRQMYSPQPQTHSSVLSTPDALMIAETFRQVMNNNQTDVNDKRLLVGEDLLRRQLQSEQGMSVSEVERRTSTH